MGQHKSKLLETQFRTCKRTITAMENNQKEEKDRVKHLVKPKDNSQQGIRFHKQNPTAGYRMINDVTHWLSSSIANDHFANAHKRVKICWENQRTCTNYVTALKTHSKRQQKQRKITSFHLWEVETFLAWNKRLLFCLVQRIQSSASVKNNMRFLEEKTAFQFSSVCTTIKDLNGSQNFAQLEICKSFRLENVALTELSLVLNLQ